MAVGPHKIEYEVIKGWEQMPDGWSFFEVAGVACDSKDNVYVFNRGKYPMIIFDKEGKFLNAWGEGMFKSPHGIFIDNKDNVWLADDKDHTVHKFTTDGKKLMTLGESGKAADTGYKIGVSPVKHAAGPFHRVTNVAVLPNGDMYIADGYGNARVHKFTPDGKLIKSWGESGTDPGQFNLVHNIVADADGWVYVADRENHRVQVFDGNGKYETQWNNLHRPCALCCCGGKKPNFIVGELGPGMPVNLKYKNLGPRLTIVNSEGKKVGRLGGEDGPGLETGRFLAPHGIAFDSKGDIYVGEVGVTNWKTSFPETPMPKIVRCLQKLERVPA
jgi:hypothetical protein